jgi:hypothetical protein
MVKAPGSFLIPGSTVRAVHHRQTSTRSHSFSLAAAPPPPTTHLGSAWTGPWSRKTGGLTTPQATPGHPPRAGRRISLSVAPRRGVGVAESKSRYEDTSDTSICTPHTGPGPHPTAGQGGRARAEQGQGLVAFIASPLVLEKEREDSGTQDAISSYKTSVAGLPWTAPPRGTLDREGVRVRSAGHFVRGQASCSLLIQPASIVGCSSDDATMDDCQVTAPLLKKHSASRTEGGFPSSSQPIP